MGKTMRLPNGYGSVYPLNGKRRKPFAVAITVGYNEKGKQIREIIGYVENRLQGLQMLADYHKDPYDIEASKLSIENVFKMLDPILKKEVEKNKIDKKDGFSESNYRNLINAYYNQLKPIHKSIITDIKKRQLQDLIDNSGVGNTAQGYIKNMLNRIFSYAIDELDANIPKNPADGLKIVSKVKSELHIPFNQNEIIILWENEDNYIVKIILLYLYTGLRPTELITIETIKVFIDDDYMIGGNKTDAGTDRIIPIHPAIKHIVKSLYNINNKFLIVNDNNEQMTYDYWQKQFRKVMIMLNLKHTPYDTRHTTATHLKLCGVSEADRKILLGHSLINDITNNVYTHLDHNYLLNEIKKLYYIEKGVK